MEHLFPPGLPCEYLDGVLLKVCFIGEFSGPLDEGMKNVMHHLAEQITKFHDTTILTPAQTHIPFGDQRMIFLTFTGLNLRRTKPDIIHYVPSSGLTPASLFRARTLARFTGRSRLVVSCLQLSTKPFHRKLTSTIIPDLVLVQSHNTDDALSKLGLKTRELLNGVDIAKFSPVTSQVKRSLREKYKFGNEFIILHVGHIKEGRGLELLQNLPNEKTKVIIVGSTSRPLDKRIATQLTDRGCLIWRGYYSDIQEIYNLADCYVFPTSDSSACIEIPLSVLEAMSCNLPVISTRFGGLPEMFTEGDGLFFVLDEDGLQNAVKTVRNTDVTVRTREKATPFSWERIGETLNSIYQELEAQR